MSLADYAKYKVSPPDPATLRHADVAQLLEKLHSWYSGAMQVRKLGTSVEGRPIRLVTLGTGPRRVLTWSQMHGDEPTHTAVLLDLISFLQSAPDKEPARTILTGCTLMMIPLLNPDGAERRKRNNAQDLDINRDARNLATPEGRILKSHVEESRPEFAFNLHNHHPRTTICGSTQLAAASLLVPPNDDAGTCTESMRRAAQVASVIVGAISKQCDHAVARYRADYMPTAFGEWVQSQGASTVLVEAGCWQDHGPDELVELHWSGILTALVAIADGTYSTADPSVYNALPLSDPPPQ